MAVMTDAPALLSVRATAEALSVSVNTVYRMIERGELPVIRVGFGPKATIRIDPEVLGETLARASAR